MDQAEGTQQNIVSEAPPQVDNAEKTLKQSEVNELVGRVKHEAYTKGLREGTQQQPQAQPQAAATGLGGMPQVTEDHVRQMIAEEAQKQQHLQTINKTIDGFVKQMSSGKDKYSDFDETVSKLGELKNYPHIVQLATDEGIAGDIMYELAKNPGKVATITSLSYINPELAKQEMRKLAESIRHNVESANTPNAKEPLSQVKPSTVGTDNGSNTISDLRKKSWARA